MILVSRSRVLDKHHFGAPFHNINRYLLCHHLVCVAPIRQQSRPQLCTFLRYIWNVHIVASYFYSPVVTVGVSMLTSRVLLTSGFNFNYIAISPAFSPLSIFSFSCPPDYVLQYLNILWAQSAQKIEMTETEEDGVIMASW